jgi:hypothetical protein
MVFEDQLQWSIIYVLNLSTVLRLPLFQLR